MIDWSIFFTRAELKEISNRAEECKLMEEGKIDGKSSDVGLKECWEEIAAWATKARMLLDRLGRK
jgi:hypothetical protein